MDENQDQVEEKTTPSPSDEEKSPSDEFDFEDDLKEDSEDAAPRKRTAEARINQLIAKNKELEGRLNNAEDMMQPKPEPVPAPAPQQQQPDDPQVNRAIEFLKERGFTTQDDLTKSIQELNDRQVLMDTHRTLEGRYDGEDGRPAYKRSDVEQYMRDKGVYDPEVAYKAKYETELLDWSLKQVEQDRKDKPYVEQAGASAATQGDQTITREKVAKSALTPKGRQWYERNRLKILELASKGLLK